jgi:flagellin-like protein
MVKKKAVSPIVSTVLLIMIVVTLAVIILIWTRGFIKEAITKDIGGETKEVDQLCSSEVKLRGIVDEVDNSFGFTNNGNVPIFAFDLKLIGNDGSSSIVKVDSSVNPGMSTNLGGSYKYTDYKQVKVIPIILGKTKSGSTQEVECPEVTAINL